MKKIRLLFLLIVAPLCLSFTKNVREKQTISLDGIWNFKLDPMNVSIPVKGSNFTSKFPETIILPGSTDQAGKGYKTQDMTSIRLTRLFEYRGAAWYEKTNVYIPEEWKDKEVYIYLERVQWESKLWVNGAEAGSEESLSTPHIYRITPFIKPGEKNVIRLRIDNSLKYDIAYTHAISAETQTNWNGIVGRMQLQAFDKTHIRAVQVYS
ncbi:MAG: glycoside hydrolase family 2, partial [Dysgonamonadaceae bacterium]|nr:glycoside hydrolase family 2 [Dysgonamonadaceae bacterium]